MSDALQQAIAYLDAKKVGEKYAIFADQAWWIMAEADLPSIERYANDFKLDGGGAPDKETSIACFIECEPHVRVRAAWWKPGQTRVWRCGHCGRVEVSMLTSRGRNLRKRCNDCGFKVSEFYIITVDLETGEEVPA